jgi:hypothetical protein
MRRQLYEWQINRQTNGYSLPTVTDGTTFESIAGIPFSIFTGGIGNNITMPAATTATQFVAIDNMRCSPSWFLSGAAVLEVYNAGRTILTTGSVARATFVGAFPGVGSLLSAAVGILNVDNVGTGYTAGDILTIAHAGGSATIEVLAPVGGAGEVQDIDILTPGSGFTIGQAIAAGAITGGTGTGFAITLIAIGTGFTDSAANAMTTVTGAGSGGTIKVDVVGAVAGGCTTATSQLNTIGTGSGYLIGDTFTIGGVNGLVGTITVLGTYTPVTSIPLDGGSGATGANQYSPSGSGTATEKPELAFQTTHVNPSTSIAGPLMFMQLLINTTSYFNETDGTVGPGLPGTASPCPEMASCRATYDFESPVYILPGQQWDVQVTVYNDSRAFIGDSTKTYNFSATNDPSLGTASAEDLCCLVQYTLYDGPDALIASKLVEMGVAVRPENIDWYKRQLLEGTI